MLQVLFASIAHPSEAVRIDCLDLVASSPKGTEAPGMLELKVCVCVFPCVCASSCVRARIRVYALKRRWERGCACLCSYTYALKGGP